MQWAAVTTYRALSIPALMRVEGEVLCRLGRVARFDATGACARSVSLSLPLSRCVCVCIRVYVLLVCACMCLCAPAADHRATFDVRMRSACAMPVMHMHMSTNACS
jgi:hypothetical protein